MSESASKNRFDFPYSNFPDDSAFSAARAHFRLPLLSNLQVDLKANGERDVAAVYNLKPERIVQVVAHKPVSLVERKESEGVIAIPISTPPDTDMVTLKNSTHLLHADRPLAGDKPSEDRGPCFQLNNFHPDSTYQRREGVGLKDRTVAFLKSHFNLPSRRVTFQSGLAGEVSDHAFVRQKIRSILIL
ncbi:hypothetical protein B0H13DRAFT_2394745 [Mycena leptocephala]|nr:hypothetical protein B0H13DRAFT_2394745 [Mycena leptocephala]